MTDGFYKRRRGVVEHMESRAISFLEDGIHDYLNLKANLVIGNGYSLPAGVCLTSAAALHAVDPSLSERTYRRKLEHLAKIGWIKAWKVRGKHGNFPVVLCRASVHDLSGNEYRVNGAETTDWRKPVYEPVHEVSASCPGAGRELSAYRELREVERGEKRKEQKPGAAKTAAPADPRFAPFYRFAFESYTEKHGQKPSWLGKDRKQLQTVLKATAAGLPELQHRWKNYLASTERFTSKQGDSLAYFCSNLDKFSDGPILAAPMKGANNAGSTADNLRGIARSLGLAPHGAN